MKIVSVNIERKKHLERLLPFLQREEPSVICLQEVMEDSVPELSETLKKHATFVPFVRMRGWEENVENGIMGIAILTTRPHRVAGVHFYEGNPELHTITRDTSLLMLHSLMPRAVLVCDCEEENSFITVATTHFTYTPDGLPDEFQRTAMNKFLEVLAPYKNMILTGDFNIPRPNALYDILTQHFTDNIPKEVVSSLDPELHRKKGLERMVDYFWTKGDYRADNVHLVSGVSDHCAVVGEVGWE